MSKPRALVVEFYDSHLETLFPQVYMLEAAGHEVWVAVQDQFVPQTKATLPGRKIISLPTRGYFARWQAPWRVAYTLWKQKIGKLAINTVASNPLRRLVLWLWFLPKVQVATVVHGANRLAKRGSMSWITTRIRRFWVISTHQRHYLPPAASKFIIGQFYPILFTDPAQPQVKVALDTALAWLSKGPDAPILVGIPGHPNPERRDYMALLDALEKTSAQPSQVQFWLLGNYYSGFGPAILEEIDRRGLSPWFRWGTGRIPTLEYHTLLRQCQLLLPLLHPGILDYEKYQTTKTSGNLNLGLGFGLPMALPHEFKVDPLIEPLKYSYPLDSLAEEIARWANEGIAPPANWLAPTLDSLTQDYMAVWQ